LSGSPGSTIVNNRSFGFAEGFTFYGDSATDRQRRYAEMKAFGAGWVRIDADWWQVEPTQGRRDWTRLDAFVNDASAAGLKVLLIVNYSAPWASGGNDKAPPTLGGYSYYRDFAVALTQRYPRSKVPAFEIWNEPNLTSFWTGTVDQYWDMFSVAADGIHAADRSAIVLPAGWGNRAAPNGSYDWLKRGFDRGLQSKWDAVATHPYNWPFPVERLECSTPEYNAWGVVSAGQLCGQLPRIRQLMVDRGDGAKQIWATEFGTPSPYSADSRRIVTLDVAAQDMANAMRLWHSYAWAGPMFVYTYRDPGTNAADPEQIFGLVTRGWVKKQPLYDSLHQALTGP
jgi:hypothetical protein